MRQCYPADFPILKACSLTEAVDRVSSPVLVEFLYRQSFLTVQYPSTVFSESSMERIRGLQLPAGILASGCLTDMQYMERACLAALEKKTNGSDLANVCPVERMLAVLNTIYRIRAPMLKSYLLSPVSGIKCRSLGADGVALESSIKI